MTTSVSSLRAELRSDSADVATATPRLSWIVSSDDPEWQQVSAEIEVDDQTVILAGAESVLVEWPFAALAPREQRSLRVRVTGQDGVTSPWSEPCLVRASFLAAGEWVAPMIGAAESTQPLLLRNEFSVKSGLSRATLYATAQGTYQVWANGAEVDDQILKPGWTPYDSRLIHESTDVTALLAEGDNALGVELAGGWYTERVGFTADGKGFYGDQPSAAVQVLLEYQDGSTQTVVSGPDWRCTDQGPGARPACTTVRSTTPAAS